jgi:photosystem II stability/assembly factor-like uncharacterized protein
VEGSVRLLAACDDGLAILSHDGGGWRLDGRRLHGRGLNALARAGDTVLAGGRDGVVVSRDGGEQFREQSDGLDVRYVRWLARADTAGERVLAGTEPAAAFHARTGERWHASTGITEERDRLGWFLPYSPEAGCVRGFATHGERVYAAVEVGGLLRSDDGGRSFRLCGGSDGRPHLGPSQPDVLYPDVHSVATHPSSPDRVVAATAGGIYVSEDGGETFERRSPAWYVRAVHVDDEDFDHLVVGAANRVSDKQGRIERTRDGGRSYTRDPGAEGPWPQAIVERFAYTPHGLFAIRDDGVLLTHAGDAWEQVDVDGARVRACVVAP